MATISAEHINPFLMAAKKILQDVCFMEVGVQKPVLKQAVFAKDSWVIIVGITGELGGQVLLVMSRESACGIASKMCMTEITEIDEFAASALSELGNMIMGNAATVFSSNGIGIDITPPNLLNGEGSLTNSYGKGLCVPLKIPEGEVELYLALKVED